jgi:hypothetical protein
LVVDFWVDAHLKLGDFFHFLEVKSFEKKMNH